MKILGIIVALPFALGMSTASAEMYKKPQILRGKCTEKSHLAEGLQTEDLTRRQSRFYCDSVVITNPNDDLKRVLIMFAQAQSSTTPQIGFAGELTERDVAIVQRVYLQSGITTQANEGVCKIFRTNGLITSLFCGAKIDNGNRRTVPIVAFEVDAAAHQTEESSEANLPAYRESGVARCSCPGTDVEFFLDGEGGARLTNAKSNYVGFTNAAKVKKWSAMLADKDGQTLLVLDNGRKSRIMTDPKSGKAMGFLADGGVSDMLCQVLVRPK